MHHVTPSGEPGIGKSRIAQTILERISAEPHTRLRYFCSPHHQDRALYPSIAQLERAAGLRRDDTAEQRLEKLEAVLAQGTNDLSEAVPLLADLLSIPTGDRYPPLNLTPQKRKEKTLHALLAQVEGLAMRQPVLMVWEDIHWSDPTTRESLDLLIDREATLRVLVIITFRSEFSPPWIGRPQVTMLTLNRLSPRQRADMIRGVMGSKDLPKEVSDQIIERTDGIPLFIEELTKAVIETGVVAEVGDRYRVAGPLTPLAIPTSLHGSLLARLDRLAPVREVAQIAAALGRQFSHELISAVAPIPQQQLDDALDQLVGAELIFRRGTRPEAEYTFKHALVQDAAYSTLLKSRRQQIHARIVATLEERFPEIVATQPELLAHHCTQAGFIEKAIGYRLRAGQQELMRSAAREAEGQLLQGLNLVSSLMHESQRQQYELDIRANLASALISSRGYSAPEVRENIARSRALAEELNKTEYLVPTFFGQWAYHLVRSEHKLALSVAKQMKKVCSERDDTAGQLLARRESALSHFFLGEFVTARTLFENCQGLDNPAHRAVYAAIPSEDPHVTMLANLALTLAYLGYPAQGRSLLKKALAQARALRHAAKLAIVLNFAFWMESLLLSEDMQQHAHEMVSLATEHGFPFFLAFGTMCRGRSLAVLGQDQEAVNLITTGLSAFRTTGAIASTAQTLIWLAEVYVKVGRLNDGENCLAEASGVISRTDERYHAAECDRVRGDLLIGLRDEAAAEYSFRQALRVANAQSAKIPELLAASSLAHLWRDQGKCTEARDLLAPIYGWFTEGFDTPALKDAKALLDQLT
jgi:hypothetical protein